MVYFHFDKYISRGRTRLRGIRRSLQLRYDFRRNPRSPSCFFCFFIYGYRPSKVRRTNAPSKTAQGGNFTHAAETFRPPLVTTVRLGMIPRRKLNPTRIRQPSASPVQGTPSDRRRTRGTLLPCDGHRPHAFPPLSPTTPPCALPQSTCGKERKTRPEVIASAQVEFEKPVTVFSRIYLI